MLATVLFTILAGVGVRGAYHDERRPIAYEPAAGVATGTCRINGRNFGTAQAGSQIEYRDNPTDAFTVVASTAGGVTWGTTSVTFACPAFSGQARVTINGVGTSNTVNFYVYSLTQDAAIGDGTEVPLAVDRYCPAGVCDDWFLMGEYNNQRAYRITAAGTITTITFPQSAAPGPFTSDVGFIRSQISGSAESVLVVGNDVFFSQGGGYGYAGTSTCNDTTCPNHSRVVRYSTTSSTVTGCYNLPGDFNSIVGLGYDTDRARVGVAATNALLTNGSIWTFDPNQLVSNCTLDFGATEGQSCAGNQAANCPVFGAAECPTSDAACWRQYGPMSGWNALDKIVYVGGAWWAGLTLSNGLGRVDPVTGTGTYVPFNATPIGGGRRPWTVTPLDTYLTWTEEATRTMGRTLLAGAPSCTTLAGQWNPCIEVLPLTVGGSFIPGVTHSTYAGSDGRLWFTMYTSSPDTEGDGLGFIGPNWDHTMVLDVAALQGDGVMSSTGLHVAPDDTVTFAQFWGRRMGKLVRLN